MVWGRFWVVGYDSGKDKKDSYSAKTVVIEVLVIVLRNSQNLQIPKHRTERYKKSFLAQILKDK